MTDQKMDVFLLGVPQPGIERATLISNLAVAFKKDVPSIEKMLRRPRTLVKSDIESTLAEKYKAIIERAGGQCELAVHGALPEPSLAETPKAPVLALESIASVNNKEEAESPQEDETDSDAAGYCVKCGTVIRVGQVKCSRCFTPVSEFSSKNKTTAGLLAFFFGGLGVHRFYLGQWWGIFYLLFWGTFIPSIVSIVEAVVFWSSSQESWDKKYGRVPRSSGTMALVLIVGAFLMVAVMGILAAVAVPAYQDYTTRAKIQRSMPLVLDARNKVTAFVKQHKTYPDDNVLVGLPEHIQDVAIESIKLGDQGTLEVTYHIANLRENNSIVWTPLVRGTELVWTCQAGTMNDLFRPTECRGGDHTATLAPQSHKKASATLAKTIDSNDKHFSLKVPESWEPKNLLETALLGAANLREENYVIVIVDPKTDYAEQITLDTFSFLIQKQLAANIQNGKMQGKVSNVTVAGLPAQRFVFTGNVDQMKVGYIVTLVEADKNFYRIMAWTLQSRLELNTDVLTKVSDSLTFNE